MKYLILSILKTNHFIFKKKIKTNRNIIIYTRAKIMKNYLNNMQESTHNTNSKERIGFKKDTNNIISPIKPVNQEEIVDNFCNLTKQRSSRRVKSPHFMKIIQNYTNFPAIYVVLPIVIAGMFIFFRKSEIFLTNFIGIIYPFYWSLKAFKQEKNNKIEQKKWFSYWISFLSLLLVDSFIGNFLKKFPYLYFIKYCFLCWMFLPNFNGAIFLYDNLIIKYFHQIETIQKVQNFSTNFKSKIKNIGSKISYHFLCDEAEENNFMKNIEKTSSKNVLPTKQEMTHEKTKENFEITNKYNKEDEKKEEELKEKKNLENKFEEKEKISQYKKSLSLRNIKQELPKDVEDNENENEDIRKKIPLKTSKSMMLISKEKINSTIKKIKERILEHDIHEKSTENIPLFESEIDKRRYEQQIRETNENLDKNWIKPLQNKDKIKYSYSNKENINFNK